jgi:hypothetical protein
MAITAVMTSYPAAIVEWATDPRTGIQATEQYRSFPPNSGEVKAFCDSEVRRIHEASKERPNFRKRDYVPPESYPGCRANLLMHADAPQFGAVEAWSKSPDADDRDWRYDDRGRLWIALSVWNNLSAGRLTAGRQVGSVISDAELRARYGRAEAEAGQ